MMKIILPLLLSLFSLAVSADDHWLYSFAGQRFTQNIDVLVENKNDGTPLNAVIDKVAEFIEQRISADVDFKFYFSRYPHILLEKIGSKIRENQWDVNDESNDHASTTLMTLIDSARPALQIKIALAAGANPNIADKRFFESPLLYAVKRYGPTEDQLPEVVRSLLQHGAHLQGTFSAPENSPLRLAIEKSYFETLKVLVEEGINRGVDAMASFAKDENYAKKLLGQMASILNYLSPLMNLNGPLKNMFNSVSLLSLIGDKMKAKVQSGALDLAHGDDDTPLMEAAREKMFFVVASFLRAGITTFQGNHLDNVMWLLLKNLAPTNLKQLFTTLVVVNQPLLFEKALRLASTLNKVNVVKALLEKFSSRLNVNAPDREGKTALMNAAEYGHLDIVNLLIKQNNILVNAQDYEGNSALHLAVLRDRPNVIRLLMTIDKIDVKLQNLSGKSALDSAAEKGQDDIVELLGTDPSIVRDLLHRSHFPLLSKKSYRFTVKCQIKKNNSASPEKDNSSLSCLLMDGSKTAGKILAKKIVDKNPHAHIRNLDLCRPYQKRGLSSVLLYHMVQLIDEIFKSKEISLDDESSVLESTGMPHYTRYGFRHIFSSPWSLEEYGIGTREFLDNPKNRERYRYRHEGVSIVFEPRIETVDHHPSLECD